ncbi:MAG: hypothetical protein AB9915_02855 [Candidatus Dojkabacteria bacterium]
MEPKGVKEEIENLVNVDCSTPEYQEDSEKILKTIRVEILLRGYKKVVHYHGISVLEPDREVLSNGSESKILDCNNCLYPEKYRNVQIFVVKDDIVHWFVVVK